MKYYALALFFSMALLGCSIPDSSFPSMIPPIFPSVEPTPFAFPTASINATPTPTPEPAKLKTWIYQLTGYENNFDRLLETPSDILVVDAMRQTPDTFFRSEEVQKLRKKHPTVLAYVSIGEAEDYRYYFIPEWKKNPPTWMGRNNPNWTGNIKVKYWDPAWQKIILEYVDRVSRIGFDGVYLDIVDGFEYWSDPDTNESEILDVDDAALRMIALIRKIRETGKANNDQFLVFPQNAPELLPYPGYLAAIDGFGKEDLYFNGYNELIKAGSKAAANPDQESQYDVDFLRLMKDAGKTVLVVDYFDPTQTRQAADFESQAREEGFIPYAADRRALDRISSFFEAKEKSTTPATQKEIESKNVDDSGLPPEGESESFDASRKCVKLCEKARTDGRNLSAGPCLSNELFPNFPWVCDVAHKPRQDIDNLEGNTCAAFGKTADHFVEVDENCTVIDVA